MRDERRLTWAEEEEEQDELDGVCAWQLLAEEKLVEEIELMQPLEPSSLLVVAAAELEVFILRAWKKVCDRLFSTCDMRSTVGANTTWTDTDHQEPWTDPRSSSLLLLCCGCHA